jgi:NAD(P)H-hydrate repair Nnr-like enzyme with NAD(P)H-hydrate dehydratase domain
MEANTLVRTTTAASTTAAAAATTITKEAATITITTTEEWISAEDLTSRLFRAFNREWIRKSNHTLSKKQTITLTKL